MCIILFFFGCLFAFVLYRIIVDTVKMLTKCKKSGHDWSWDYNTKDKWFERCSRCSTRKKSLK